MEHISLSTALSRASYSRSEQLLFLEQEPYSPYVGKVTKGQMAVAVLGWINPDTFPYDTRDNCGGEEGVFETILYAYLYDQELRYQIALSWGELGQRTIETVEYVEDIKCSLREVVDFSYPCERLVSAEWTGNAYDNEGNLVPYPKYTHDNRSMFFEQEIWGTLKVHYTVTRHRYEAKIESREHNNPDETVNKYQSVLYAWWNGGVEWLDVAAPEGFEETDGACGNGTITEVPDPEDDPDDPPKAWPNDENTYIDYCTQVEIKR